MVRPVKKRGSDISLLMSAIKFVRIQKQVPNLERIARVMFREHEMDAMQVEKALNSAVKSGSIEMYTAMTRKGPNAGMEQDGYRLPVTSEVDVPVLVPKTRRKSSVREKDSRKHSFDRSMHGASDHDWYCFECQKSELLINCAECWRSWHSDCTDIDVTNPETFVCAICLEVDGDVRKKSGLSTKYINVLLGYTLQRLRDKMRELYHLPLKDFADQWAEQVYYPMDLNRMEEKTQGRKYKCSEEFVADAKTVTHDLTLACGAGSPMSSLAVTMLNDCMYEVDEIRQCHNCYYMSNLKPPDWFCQPCNPPHELVYAKQTGFSYWPAKIIYKLDEEKYDVRFFGGYHQRAVVPKKCIQPISTNIQQISVKRTAGFVKACGELEKHKQLLASDKPTKYAFSDSESEVEEETVVQEEETRRVSSTSIVKANTVKSPLPEDGNLVTSSEDNVPAKKQKPIETSSTHTQTKERGKLLTKSSQTEKKMGDPLCDCATSQHPDETSSNLSAETDVGDAKPATLDTKPAAPEASGAAGIAEGGEVKPAVEEQDQAKAMADLQTKLLKDFEEDKQQAISRAMANMQQELERTRKQTEERCKETHAEEVRRIQSKHKEVVSVIKHKQWCYNCEAEAMYHCCWNTSYCSIKCQQEHWHKEHKRVCRRKR